MLTTHAHAPRRNANKSSYLFDGGMTSFVVYSFDLLVLFLPVRVFFVLNNDKSNNDNVDNGTNNSSTNNKTNIRL